MWLLLYNFLETLMEVCHNLSSNSNDWYKIGKKSFFLLYSQSHVIANHHWSFLNFLMRKTPHFVISVQAL